MAFNVRIFGYRGLRQIPQRLVKQKTMDTVFVLDEPYAWSQLLVVNGATPVESAPNIDFPDLCILRIEIPDEKTVRYEINQQGLLPATHRDAGNLSPALAGRDQFHFGSGWTISLVDAESFP